MTSKRRRLLCTCALVAGLVAQMFLIASLRDSHLLSQHRNSLDSLAANYTLSSSTSALPDKEHPLLIIIVSSARSGSSLLGQMLSTSPSTAYFFEPFYYHTKHNIPVSNMSSLEVGLILKDLLACRLKESPVMRSAALRRFIWKTVPSVGPVPPGAATLASRCALTTSRVIKLVRLPLLSVLPLLRDAAVGPRLRVIYLVRDPRGSINSKLHAPELWASARHDFTWSCRRIHSDLAVGRAVHDPRYLQVSYDDLALRPRMLADRLYRFLGVPQPPSLVAYLDSHMKVPAIKLPKVLSQRAVSVQARQWKKYRARLLRKQKAYFGTRRGADFDPFHWRKELKPDVLAQIERECADVIADLQGFGEHDAGAGHLISN